MTDINDKFGSMAPLKHSTTRRKGEPGEFNWAATDAGTAYYGKIGTSSASFQFPAGKKVNCNPKAKDRFLGFLNELDARGYHAKDVSALCIRKKRGGSTMSIHSWGAAMDVDPDTNPFQPNSTHPSTVFPENVEKLAWKYGLSWGARFGDAMHFEAGSPTWWGIKLLWLRDNDFLSADEVYEIARANKLNLDDSEPVA